MIKRHMEDAAHTSVKLLAIRIDLVDHKLRVEQVGRVHVEYVGVQRHASA
jgi:hypothetical protein